MSNHSSFESGRRRALVLDREADRIIVDVRDIPSQAMSVGKVRIAPAVVGICGSDLDQLRGETHESFAVPYPHVLGHEWSGTVVEVAPGAPRYLQPGVPVIGHGFLGRGRWLGVSSDGAMAEEFVVDSGSVFLIPPGCDMTRAALIEPFACCVSALRKYGLMQGEGRRALVVGCGPLGLAMVALLSTCGWAVQAIDLSSTRTQLALEMGAVEVAPDEDQQYDLVVEASGSAGGMRQAVDRVAPRGRILLMGLGSSPVDGLSLYRIQTEEIEVGYSTGAPPEVWPLALGYVIAFDLELERMVTASYTIDEVDEAFAAAADAAHHGKVVFKFE